MTRDPNHEITLLIQRAQDGDRDAFEALAERVYPELRSIARRKMARERANHTLQPTILVDEVLMNLAGQRNAVFRNRKHFYAVAALIMKRLLIDHARRHRAQIRGGDVERVPIDEALDAAIPQLDGVDAVALARAFEELEQLHPRQCQVITLRFFLGLTIRETAEELGIETATVKRDQSVGLAFLQLRLKGNAT